MNTFPAYVIDVNGELCHVTIDNDGYFEEHNIDTNEHSLFSVYPMVGVTYLGQDWALIDNDLLKSKWSNYKKHN